VFFVDDFLDEVIAVVRSSTADPDDIAEPLPRTFANFDLRQVAVVAIAEAMGAAASDADREEAESRCSGICRDDFGDAHLSRASPERIHPAPCIGDAVVVASALSCARWKFVERRGPAKARTRNVHNRRAVEVDLDREGMAIARDVLEKHRAVRTVGSRGELDMAARRSSSAPTNPLGSETRDRVRRSRASHVATFGVPRYGDAGAVVERRLEQVAEIRGPIAFLLHDANLDNTLAPMGRRLRRRGDSGRDGHEVARGARHGGHEAARDRRPCQLCEAYAEYSPSQLFHACRITSTPGHKSSQVLYRSPASARCTRRSSRRLVVPP